jgi:thiol-disulfide isomerase/thioredoxin
MSMTHLRLIVYALLIGAASLAQAFEVKPYSADALARAEKAGQPVALHFHADWCPTCRAQDKTLQSMKDEKGLDLTILTVNYDTEKDLKKRFAIRMQSTLVVLKGDKEVSRLAGDSSADGLRGALKAAL